MLTFIITALFALGTAFAASTILRTFRHYHGAAGALRTMLTQCHDEQVVRIAVCEWTVMETAQILRPDFTRPLAAPIAGPGLRAAA